MAAVNIFVFIEGTGITFANSESGRRDKELTTNVECKDVVTWKTKSKGLILTNIIMKPGSESIWSPGKEPGKHLTGTICETAAGKSAAYSVLYTINGGKPQEQDPDIKVEE